MRELNPSVWFGTREVSTIPRHFIKSSTPHSNEAYQWVLTKLSGRYGTASTQRNVFNAFETDTRTYFFFEDPKEAMLYELRWAGAQNNSLY